MRREAQHLTIPVVEETVTVGKRRVPTEELHVHRRIKTEEHVVDVPLHRERLDVTRVPVDQVTDEVPEVRRVGDTVIVPVVEEEIVVRKRYRVREELHIRTSHELDSYRQSVVLRRQEAEIERRRPDAQHLDSKNTEKP